MQWEKQLWGPFVNFKLGLRGVAKAVQKINFFLHKLKMQLYRRKLRNLRYYKHINFILNYYTSRTNKQK